MGIFSPILKAGKVDAKKCGDKESLFKVTVWYDIQSLRVTKNVLVWKIRKVPLRCLNLKNGTPTNFHTAVDEIFCLY